MGQHTKPTILEQHLIPGGTRTTLNLSAGDMTIPSVLITPTTTPAPAALLLHGYSSRKEVMMNTVGRALLRHGVASLSIDLPLHGTRSDPLQLQSLRNPIEAVRLWRLALREAALAIAHLASRPDIHPDRLAIVGYSLGSFLSVTLAASEPRVRAVVLAAGGDLPLGTPLTTVARTIADPTRAVRKLGGRPLLMVNGRHDDTIRAEQAQRLYAAANDPKEIRWWNAGHALPEAAIDEAAHWLARHLNAAPTTSLQ